MTPLLLVDVELQLELPSNDTSRCGIEQMKHVLLDTPSVQHWSCWTTNRNLTWMVSMVVRNDTRLEPMLNYLRDMHVALDDAFDLLGVEIRTHEDPVKRVVSCDWPNEYYEPSRRRCTAIVQCGTTDVFEPWHTVRHRQWEHPTCVMYSHKLLILASVVVFGLCLLQMCTHFVSSSFRVDPDTNRRPVHPSTDSSATKAASGPFRSHLQTPLRIWKKGTPPFSKRQKKKEFDRFAP